MPLPWLLQGGFTTHALPSLSLTASNRARRSEGSDMVKVQGIMSAEAKSQSSEILHGSTEEAAAAGVVCSGTALAALALSAAGCLLGVQGGASSAKG